MVDAITAAFASATDSIQDVFTDNLGSVMAIFGALVALGVILRITRRTVGKKA